MEGQVMGIIPILIELSIDEKTVCLIWSAVIYERRLKAIELLIINMTT